MNPPTQRPAAPPAAALGQLAAALDRDHYTAKLVADDGQAPYLLVASRHAQLSEAVFVDGKSYLWPWGQPIAAIGSPDTAASKVATVLAATPEPTHG